MFIPPLPPARLVSAPLLVNQDPSFAGLAARSALLADLDRRRVDPAHRPATEGAGTGARTRTIAPGISQSAALALGSIPPMPRNRVSDVFTRVRERGVRIYLVRPETA